MASSQTLTLDSTDLFLTAQSYFFHQPPPPVSLSPFPSAFPQSKYIPNTRFTIDAFRHAGDYSVSYFLSHFHSDHYGGLSSNWSKGIVFCSHTTARLLSHVLKVPSVFIVGLPLRETLVIDGCEVVLVDANHCPGAVQFLFKVPGLGGKIERYVHSGDFRFFSSMKSDPLLREFVGSDTVFLDTTYCNPKFVFPLQEESIDYIVRVIEEVGGEYNGSTRNVLFLVATYVIGKEKILLEIARRCNRKVHVDARKLVILRALGYEESGVFTEDECESDVHVVGWNVLGETWPYFRPNFVRMSEIMVAKGYSRTVGFVPTGWTYEVKHNKFSVKSKDSFEIHLVPYSEHSNYDELREYVRFLKPKRVVPTVGLDVEKLDSKHASKMKKHFAGLLDEMAIKQEFLRGFHRGFTEVCDQVEKGADNSPSEKLHQEKDESTSDMKPMENNDIGVLEETFPLQQPDSQILSSVTDEEVDKVLEALRDSLPSWVTRDQMLNLTCSNRMDIVDIVSSFYERETEFYEQVFATKTPNSLSQPSLQNDSTSFPNSDTDKSGLFEKIDIRVSQRNKSLSPGDSFKSGISPGRRKRKTENKQNKKVKMESKLETSGSKQSTITRFFSKVTTVVSKDNEIRSVHEESPKDKILACNATEYSNEINQFIQIVNGNESLKNYAANILAKTKGDINEALDLYYQNPESKYDEIKVRKLIPSQHGTDKCPFGQKEIVFEKVFHTTDLSIRRLSVEDVDAASVSVPLEKYNPVENACWNDGHPAPYLHLARTFDLLEEEKGKIKATSMLCNMFRSLLALSPVDVLPAVYLCTNKIAADHENMELNIGGSLVTAALVEACGTNRLKIREMYNDLGDLGDVAQACRQTQTLLAPPSPLLIRDVFSALQKISVQTGSGSTARKKNLIVNLMRSCREKEMKFLVRTLVRNLRIGAMIRTILPALAQAVAMISLPNFHHEQTAEFWKDKLQCLSAAVIDAYNVVPSLDLVVTSLMKNGIEFSSSTLSMVPGIPIKPMLAKITNGVPQALKIFENKAFTCEYKYDGQRAQIHKLSDGSFRVFSRNGDESTSRFPDLINTIKKYCNPNAEAFILDAEIVAIDRKNGCKLMSFQELSSRGRGSKDTLVALDSIKVAICAFIFDIMLANGNQLLGAPLRQRRKYFKELFRSEKMGYLEFAKEITVEADDSCLTNDATLTKINSFLENAFLSSCEGIMVKSLDADAGYCPSKRTDTWLKVKRDYVEGLNDSLDLVPIGAWHGNGRKAGWYSPFLMACYNPDTEEFQSICRVMSGFSDSFYKEMKVFFSGDRIFSKKPPYYRTGEVPDMWFSPELVWQIRGADFTVSPVHEAAIGLVHPSRGISIRFPRFICTLSDRKPEECSTAADVVELFRSQTRKMDVTAEG